MIQITLESIFAKSFYSKVQEFFFPQTKACMVIVQFQPLDYSSMHMTIPMRNHTRAPMKLPKTNFLIGRCLVVKLDAHFAE